MELLKLLKEKYGINFTLRLYRDNLKHGYNIEIKWAKNIDIHGVGLFISDEDIVYVINNEEYSLKDHIFKEFSKLLDESGYF